MPEAMTVSQKSKWLLPKVAIAVVSAALGMFSTWWYFKSAADRNSIPGDASQPATISPADNKATPTVATAIVGQQTVPTQIEFSRDSWDAAGIKVQSISQGALSETVQLTGKITLNEDHIAHIYPLVDGRVDEVLVQLGAHVKKGDVLVVVQSKEIGQTKLQLYQDRLLRDFATVKQQWTESVATNTAALIEALKKETSIDDIEEMFRDRPMGEYRAKLLSAYVSRVKSRIDYERMTTLSEDGIIPIKQLQAAEAVRNADRATLTAYLEEIDHASQHTAILATQALKEAETRVSVDETNLKILGYADEELVEIDPAREGEKLSHYPVQAPFDGTIISKDVVLLERVNTDTMILSVADLSTVWVTTDIYEEHLPLLKELSGQTIRVKSNVWPDRTFEARVFYTGEIVDEATRTIAMRAVADNAEGMLKPGMFVNVELPTSTQQNVVQIPETAILEENGKPFVFIHVGDDRFERRDVSTGHRTHDMVEIRTGIQTGESVVVKGGFALKSRMLADLLGEE